MAASKTVPQLLETRNRLTFRHGVLTLFGYGITVNVERGHLIVKDGIGANRRVARLSRIGHGIRRLVVIGSDGIVSLAALRWLADQDAAFVMIERDGSVLTTTGPVRPSDARLRRAQSLAYETGTALKIARELIYRKLSGQARQIYPATRLTQNRRRQAKGHPSNVSVKPAPRPPRICRTCGEVLKRGQHHCAECSKPFNKAGLIEAAKLGRIATHSPEAEALRAKTQRKHAADLAAWRPSDLPEWLNEEAYRAKIQPALTGITVPAIVTGLGVSEPYATDIRSGRRCPHPRHWEKLAQLAGVSAKTFSR